VFGDVFVTALLDQGAWIDHRVDGTRVVEFDRRFVEIGRLGRQQMGVLRIAQFVPLAGDRDAALADLVDPRMPILDRVQAILRFRPRLAYETRAAEVAVIGLAAEGGTADEKQHPISSLGEVLVCVHTRVRPTADPPGWAALARRR